ncbi:MAG: AraC family transcriptional regulator [Oscillospiraceae bacterium]|jgi:AraC-like DNA-binding protein|nr:AraC family transcriptional regulator [Oscillospiraceae bacterium]
MRESELEFIEHIKEAPMRLLIISLEASSPHWHEEYEVIFVLRGGVSVGGERGACELRSGDVMLVNPREVHSFRKSGAGNICLILQFSPSIISEAYEQPFIFRLNTAADDFLPAPAKDGIRRVLAEMGLILHDRPDGYQFAVKSGLYAFASIMFRYLKYENIKQHDAGRTEEYLQDFDVIKQYIKRHFKENIDQAQIGRALGMSRAKVYRVLRAAAGSSTKDMTNYYRVECAKHLLKSSQNPIRYIASESGFDSDSSFYRVFRELTGASPQEYRRSPAKKTELTGIQGYAKYSLPESLSLLRGYLA